MNRQFDRVPRAAASAAGAILLLLSQVAGQSAVQSIRGTVPMVVRGMRPLGHYDGTNRLQLAIGLPLRDAAGLDAFLHDVYDPASPSYHQFLTSSQFAERFGTTEADYESLKKFALANNLAIIGTHPNRTLLDVAGSVDDIEKTLHVSMQVYQHPTEKRTFIAADRDPTLNTDVPVLHIAGLHNYYLAHPNYVRHPVPALSSNAPASGSGQGGTYLGYDFRNAYAPGVNLDGNGQRLAVLEFDAYFPNDPVTYEGLAGLPNVTLTNVLIDGFTGLNPGSANTEVSLDIEMAISMAPGLSEVLVYEATNSGFINVNDDLLNRMVTDDKAFQLSASWSYGIDALTQQIYLQMAAQGQSFFNAAGDSAAYAPGTVPTPCDDTNITIVGGTSLFTTGPGGQWQSEAVWSYFNQGTGDGGGSGGISSTYAIPPWQQGISMAKNGGSTSFRNLPDVALTADNIFVIADNGQSEDVGGTSAATPLWAAFCSLANQQSFAKGHKSMGFINPAIYTLGKGPLYTTAFHDIITGNNTNFVSPLEFYAVVGYDLCTGWGTPTGSNMINYLAPLGTSPILAVSTNVISGGNGNGLIDYDECNNLTIVLTNEGNATATGVQGVLVSLTPGVIVAQQNAMFPQMAPGASGVSATPFIISTVPTFVCGTPVNLQLIVKSAQAVQTNAILLPSGILGTPDTFTNTTVMSIPTGNPTGISSPIAVSGLEAVGKISVSVNITTLFDGGLILQLTAPNGTSVLLSQLNGGQSPDYGVGCDPSVQTTFDDTAAQPITLGSPPFLGSFQPQEPLSTFDLYSGTNVNGVWLLNVIDQFPGDTAQLNCWDLNISPEVCVDGGGECPGSDLSLTMTAEPNPVLVTSNLTYTLVVSNAGPSVANEVVVAQSLPAGVNFVNTSNYPVSSSQSGSTLNLSVGTLQVYGSARIAVITTPTIPGLATSVATVGSPSSDPNPNNNTASATSDVTLPGADLGVTMTASPTFDFQGAPLTYTITVTNNGPFAATLVTLDTVLPPNANLLSATASQGSITEGGSVADIGTLDPGSNATVTIVVSPTSTGNVTATATVSLSSLEVDPDLLNNTASATVTIGPSADLAVTGFFSPPTILSGATYTNIATVMNNGPSAATQVAFSQTIPSGVTFVSSSATSIVVNNGILNWDAGTLASGTNVMITNIFRAPSLLAGVTSELLSSTLTVFGQPGDALTNNNVAMLEALVEPPTITITPVNATLLSGSANGAVAPGQTVSVEFFLQNTGNINTTNVIATIQHTGGVTLPTPSFASYGQLAAGAPPIGREFTFTANGTNGGTVVVTLQLTDGSLNLGTVSFTFYMPVVSTFSNPGVIQIPAKSFTPDPDEGPANPYPSQLAVSNVTGFVSDVTVTLSNISHSYPADIAMLLVGPTGQNVALMVFAGDEPPVGMVDQTLVLDQSASAALPQFGQIVSGTYRPADYMPSYSLSNAPAGPYTTNLLAFTGLSPNGTWSLYAYDTSQGNAGLISNGWAVTVTTIVPVNQEADIAASIEASTNATVLGNQVTFILNVTNNGPNAATSYLTNFLSSGLSFVSTTAAQTNYTQNGQETLYTLGMLKPGVGVSITNVVATTAGGLQTDTIAGASTLPNPNPSDSTASASVAVSLPVADVAASVTVSPNPAALDNPLTYTLIVSNLGPSDAAGVTGRFPTGGLDVVSAAASQGSAVYSAGHVNCDFGTVPAGNIATVVVTTTPQLLGNLTNAFTVATTDDDPDRANNLALAIVKVVSPSPAMTNGGVALVAQGPGFSNGAINSNETVTVNFTLNNVGTAASTNLVATLMANAGLTPVTASQNYGTIAVGASGTQFFQFTAQGAPGATITATLLLTNSGVSIGNVSFLFLIPSSAVYTQSGQIIIPEYGPGVPYPSVIQVSGVAGLVSGVTATLNGFTHTFPHDVNILLADPAGEEVFLMSHDGGAYSVTNLTLSFSDSATLTLPAGRLGTGTYLPTAVSPLNPLPGLSAAPAVSALAYFDGTNPNGNWSLYVFDDTEGNSGVISRGWSLGLSAASTVNPAARLQAGMINAPDPVFSGNFLDYLISITNLGPDVATSVVLTDTLPPGVTYSSTTLSQGTASVLGHTVTCDLGSLGVGAVATASIRVVAQSSGPILNTATVTSADTDLYLADSTTANTTTVRPATVSFLEGTNYPSGFELTLLGQPGQTYGVEVSSDLINWTTLSTNTASPTGTFTYTDTGTNQTARFYRAVRVPQ